MALPKIPTLKINALLIIILIHFGLLYLLYHLHPNTATTTYLSLQKQQEQITQIIFITRLKKSNAPSSASKTVAKQQRVEIMQIEIIQNEPKKSSPDASLEIEPAPLILSLPEPKIDYGPIARDILAQPRNTVEYQSTRFNNQFKPSGNAIDSLKWKSKTFNFITGILGGNQKICTDEDRRNRLAECVPDAYKPED